MAASGQTEEENIISSINITPLVDIFLVLLIIFMITSSVIDQREIKVSLPRASHAGAEAPKASGLVIDKAGQLYLDGRPSDSAAIDSELRRAVAEKPDYQVLISADQDLPYKAVVRGIDIVRGAGISRYALKVIRQGP